MTRAALLAAVAAWPAFAQTGGGLTDDQAEMLSGILRGYTAACQERCATDDAGPACIGGCFCVMGQLALRVDPDTLPRLPDPPGPPTGEVITAFVTDNRDAFVSSYETCDVPLQ